MGQILIVSAHPDDMEIGMGGTVAKRVASGFHAISVILTDGRRSPNPFGWTTEEIIQIRKREGVQHAFEKLRRTQSHTG